jgi:hypothetical protein
VTPKLVGWTRKLYGRSKPRQSHTGLSGYNPAQRPYDRRPGTRTKKGCSSSLPDGRRPRSLALLTFRVAITRPVATIIKILLHTPCRGQADSASVTPPCLGLSEPYRTRPGNRPDNDRVSPASVKAGAPGANATGVTAKLAGCIRQLEGGALLTTPRSRHPMAAIHPQQPRTVVTRACSQPGQ